MVELFKLMGGKDANVLMQAVKQGERQRNGRKKKKFVPKPKVGQ